jgi:hypothetical protein
VLHLLALKSLADAGLGAASVLTNLHHRRIVPLMERELRIYEIGELANPVALAHSRLVHDPFRRSTRPRGLGAPSTSGPSGIATTTSGRSLCSPTARRRVGFPSLFLYSSVTRRRGLTFHSPPTDDDRGRRVVRPAHASSPSARARRSAGAGASGTQEREKDPAAGAPRIEG